jgi:hypothetical protein
MNGPGAGRPPPSDPSALRPGVHDSIPSRRRRWWTVGFVAAIVVVAAAAVVVYEVEQGPATHVRTILLVAPDNVCGIADQTLAIAGYNSTGPAPTTVTFELPNLNGTSCTVESVGTNTSGFSVGGISVPFSIGGRLHVALTARVTPPSTSFTGDLTLVFR